jgi:uncharacterized repeat protein (TIGR01451 family)
MKKLVFILSIISYAFSLSAQNMNICGPTNFGGSDLCGAACLNCNLNGLQFTTAGYTPQTPPGWCGSVENEQWFQFIPVCNSVTFLATPSNCTDGNGIQIAVYESCSGLPIVCNGGAVGQGTTPLSITANVVPGKTYLIAIDGWAGDQCDGVLNVVPSNCITNSSLTNTIVINNPAIVGPDTACIGSTQSYTISGVTGSDFFQWDGTPGTFVNGQAVPVTLAGSATDQWLILIPIQLDSVFISAKATTVCGDTTGSQTIFKTIHSLPAASVTLPDTSFCGSQFTLPWGQIIQQGGTYFGTMGQSSGCDTVFIQTVVQTFGVPSQSINDILICTGESYQVFNQAYSQTGSYTIFGSGLGACDSIVYLRLYTIDALAKISGNPNLSCLNPNTLLKSAGPSASFSRIDTWTDIVGNVLAQTHSFLPDTPGVYIHTVSALSFTGQLCTASDTFTVNQIGQCTNIDYSISGCNNNSITVNLSPEPANLNFKLTVSNALGYLDSGLVHTFTQFGRYDIIVEDLGNPGCLQYFSIYIPSNAPTLTLSGKVYIDVDRDCTLSPGDILATGQQVKLRKVNTNISNVFVTAADGSFNINVVPGQHQFDAELPYKNCPLTISGGQCETIDSIVVLLESLDSCVLFDISQASLGFTRCEQTKSTIKVTSYNTTVQSNVQLTIAHDPLLSVVSASLPILSQTVTSLVLDLGTLSPYQSKYAEVIYLSSCNAPLGTIHCVNLAVTPSNQCNFYSGPVLKVSGLCLVDSIKFTVTNTGSDMLAPQSWYEYSLFPFALLNSGTVQLMSNESQEFISLNSSAAFLVDQHLDYPLSQQAGVEVRSCNNSQLATRVRDLNLDYSSELNYCQENVGSYDPNDKQGLPVGISPEHFIAKGSDIEYTVRFQNTGTAPAKQIRIVDTLSNLLDWSSFRVISSSHASLWNISPQGVLNIYYNDINLPDSFSSSVESQGYFSYRMEQWQSNPLGAQILNSANIYFDQNPPISTNTTLQTNGVRRFASSAVVEVPVAQAAILPNPFNDGCRVVVSNVQFAEGGKYIGELYDAYGKYYLSRDFDGNTLVLNDLTHLPQGMYFVKVYDKASRKLIVSAKAVRIQR